MMDYTEIQSSDPTSLNLQLGALLTELSDAGHQTLANRSDLPHKKIKEYLRNVGGYFILGQRIRSIDKEGLGGMNRI